MKRQVKLDFKMFHWLFILVLLLVTVTSTRAQTSNITDGTTPPGIAPGAPAGSYPLTEIEVLNVYNGNASLRFPLIKMGGRGSAQHTITLPVEQRWTVDHFYDFFGQLHHSPVGIWWYTPGPYVAGRLLARHVSDPCPQGNVQLAYTLTRVTFAGPDGTEYELRDTLTDGEKRVSYCDILEPKFNRGRVFKTADGTAATFIADADVYDSTFSGFVTPMTGYLMLRDGTRYRFDDGGATWIRDRNGNKISFSYGTGSMTITDSLNRQVLIEYNATDPSPYGLCDRISFKGFGGASRVIRISKKSLSQVLRTTQPGDSTTVKTYQQLFPELDAAYANDFNPSDKIASVWLPDGRRYQIFYNVYGEVARVVLPTGGAMEYDWEGGEQGGSLSGVTLFSEIYRKVITRRIYADGAGSILEGKSTYSKYAGSNDVTVENKDAIDAVLSGSKHYFYTNVLSSLGGGDPFGYAIWKDGKESQTEALNTAGTVLRRVTNTWQQRALVSWWIGSAEFAPPNDPRITETVITLVDTNQVAKQTFTYSNDLHNNRTDVYEFNYGQGGPGSLVRHTHTDYLIVNPVNGLDYAGDTNIHIRSLPKEEFVYDAAGVEGARTTYEYDNYTSGLMNRPNISGFDGAFTTSYFTRGNVTEIKRWVLPSTPLSTRMQYDIAGNVVSITDPKNNPPTLFDFSDRYGVPDGEARDNSQFKPELGSQVTYALATLVTNSLGHTGYTQYDYYLGKPVNGEDANGVVAKARYDDALDRATELVVATGTTLQTRTLFTYNDPAHLITTNSDQSFFTDGALKGESVYDGLGRTTETRHYETTSAYIATLQNYDGLGRVIQTSNPYRPGLESLLWTTTGYDGLGRVLTVTTPDNAVVTTSYSGNATAVRDQANKQRRSFTDALGRLTSIDEMLEYPSTGIYATTTYGYDVLDDLTNVTQGTQPPRTFVYDSLKRLKQAANPESGTANYTYDANSNLLTKQDARLITTTYGYDALNRAQTRTYTNDPQGTPQVTYSYDAPGALYSKGRLTQVTSNVSTCDYLEYDQLGRLKQSRQTTAGGAAEGYTTGYGYNLAGAMITETYPSGRVITTGFDTAGRINQISGQMASEPNKTYASQFSYASHGAVGAVQLGNTKWEHTNFNSRLQPYEIGLGASNGASDLLKLEYTYGMATNNGNVLTQKVTAPGLTLNQCYGYDSLNRLATAEERSGAANCAGTQQWKQAFLYDRYGNRNFDLVNTTANVLGPNPTISQATNRFAAGQSYGYDDAGNLTSEPATNANGIVYDAENRQTQYTKTGQPTNFYYYDGDGRRVKKIDSAGTTVFVYNAGGQLIAEYHNDPVPPAAGGGGTSYLTSDHLGSTRVVTKSDGTVKARYDYLPFGEELGSGIGGRTVGMGYSAADSTKQKFTQKERDIESGLDYFLARYYSSAQGRFTSPDKPLIGQDEEDPQTWNLYLYTSNNPLSRVDPDGERWFYTQDGNGRVTDAQWVNPNDDGTYTSPGEGWIEFIPTQSRPSLWLYTNNGNLVTLLGENADGSPRSKTLSTGRVEDASLDIVGLFIPGRLGLKGLLAGASALWTKHVARKAAKEAFEEALAGGRHAGFLKNYLTRSKQEIEKGIRSIKKQIATHEDKIANPEKHIPEWNKLDPRHRDHLVRQKWPSDIQRQKEQLGILKEIKKQK